MTASTTTRWRRHTDAESATGSPFPVWYSLVLAGLLMAATVYGLLSPEAYPGGPGIREDFGAVMRGQDVLTLLAVPVLVWTAVAAHRGSFRAHLVWLGVVFYAAYSYVLYAFSPFNQMFLVYVAILGMSGFALLVGLLRIDVHAVADAFRDVPRRAVAWFLLAVGVIFAALWVGMLVPTVVEGQLPATQMLYDIPSGVYVLDLAFMMPLILATGWALLGDRHPAAVVLAGLLLIKIVTLGLALLAMNAGAAVAGFEPNLGESGLWLAMIIVSAAFLGVSGRRMGPVPGRWLRPSMWR